MKITKFFKKNLSTLILSCFLAILLIVGFLNIVRAESDLFPNPLKWEKIFCEEGQDDCLINELMGRILIILIPIALLIFVWTAVKFIRASATGNEQKITEAKKGLLWAFIGLAILVMAEGLLLVLQDYFDVKNKN